jgi:1-acyl-sn-glycerol-3-phosphate acyltransferase
MLKWLHTTLFWSYLALMLPVLFVPALAVFLVTFPFDRNGRILHYFTCLWCGHHVWTNPMWRLDVRGKQNIDRRRAYVYASNHQSAGDIPALFTLLLPFKFVSKHTNFWVPFLGWNMYLNRYVRLVRGDVVSIRQMMIDCRGWLARGVSIMMFPEGTRSPDGRMLPFRLGAFRLAQEAKVPVVPIVIDGTLEALPKDGVLRQTKVLPIRIRIGEPLDSMQFANAEQLGAAVRARMQEMQAVLWKERGFAPAAHEAVEARAAE